MIAVTRKFKGLTAVGVFAFSLFSSYQVFADVAVIVHPSNDSSIDQSAIKRMFLGKTKAFSNGRSAILLSLDPSSPITEEFNREVMGKSGSQIKAHWSKMIFTGKGTPPQEMASIAEIISAVSANPDAIAFVDAASVTDAVKVIATF